MTVPAQVLAAVRSIPHPRQEPDMTAVDKTTASDAEFRARVAGFDGAAYPSEVTEAATVERVAEALWNAIITKWDVEDWDEQGDELRSEYRRLAAAAVAAMSAPLAGQHTTDEETDRG